MLLLLLGSFFGSCLAGMFQRYNHWIIFGLLTAVGGHMLYEAFWRLPDKLPADPTRGIRMVAPCLGANIDALAVGLSLGIGGVRIWFPVVVIGLVNMGLSFLGIYLGGRLHSNLGMRMEIVGGIVIIIVALCALSNLQTINRTILGAPAIPWDPRRQDDGFLEKRFLQRLRQVRLARGDLKHVFFEPGVIHEEKP